jgi:hypothetical protein
VGVARVDLDVLRCLLAGWDMHVAAAGHLTPWVGQPLHAWRDQNNLWCRRVRAGAWLLDVTIAEGTERRWIYRRDRSVQVPWDRAVLRTAGGIPYLAPDLQLLYKSKAVRPKDALDAAEVIPELDAEHRTRLGALLPNEHEWQRLLR